MNQIILVKVYNQIRIRYKSTKYKYMICAENMFLLVPKKGDSSNFLNKEKNLLQLTIW